MKYLTSTALTLTLILNTPASADLYNFEVHHWRDDSNLVTGGGILETAARELGVPVFIVSGSFTYTNYFDNFPACNLRNCPAGDSKTLNIIGASAWGLGYFAPYPPMLSFEVEGQSDLRFITMRGASELTVYATPGPIAGATLPALALGWLGLWGYRRRKSL